MGLLASVLGQISENEPIDTGTQDFTSALGQTSENSPVDLGTQDFANNLDIKFEEINREPKNAKQNAQNNPQRSTGIEDVGNRPDAEFEDFSSEPSNSKESEQINSQRFPVAISAGVPMPQIFTEGNEIDNEINALIDESMAPPVTVSEGIPVNELPAGTNATQAPPTNKTAPAKIPSTCWRSHYGRGVGTIPNTCNGKKRRQGLLCHDKCKPGYRGVGFICWKKCPSGFHNDGLTCRRPKPLRIVNREKYSRGIGTPMVCPPDKEYRAGLCYKKCKEGYKGIATVCWASCPPTHPINCGAFCAQSKILCGTRVFTMVQATSQLLANVIAIAITGGAYAGYKASLSAGKVAATGATKATQKFVSLQLWHMPFVWHLVQVPNTLKNRVIEELVISAATGQAVQLASLDPTGVYAVISAFKFPICKM